jgi:glycine/D-amino acid oxidase-like deaminating enzyme/nitrite reductase/ring-hydroxylating ferredoxin subunit
MTADMTGSSRHLSPWLDGVAEPESTAAGLTGEPVEVLVIGAGIFGMSSALLLRQAGKRVTVVEAGGLASTVTAHSTVKVTVGHTLALSRIEAKRGRHAAAAYALANTAGYAQILDFVQELDIDCDLQTGLPHLIYAEQADEVESLRKEAALAAELGLPVALLPDPSAEPSLPFPVFAAVAYENQATLHPGRYLAGLTQAFVDAGGTLVRGARADGVQEKGGVCRVSTTAGEVVADSVVVATSYPILDRGGQFSRLKPSRSYGIAGVLPAGTHAGMTISVGSPTHSTRTVRLDGEDLLIVVGESHEVGKESDTSARWDRLQEWAGERYGVTDFRYHWSAQDNASLDHVPFAGYLVPGSRRILTGTGFDGWGMTNGTACAILVRDLLTGQENAWADTFDARRAIVSVPGPDVVKQNLTVAKRWVEGHLTSGADRSPEQLAVGEAMVCRVDGEETAAYRDEAGQLHAVSAVCTHLKCTVSWNGGERSWDCPCHGSRFSVDGEVLQGPARTPLEDRRLAAPLT